MTIDLQPMDYYDSSGFYPAFSPAGRKNGEFDIVTQDPKGYIFYEAKFTGVPLDGKTIKAEIDQVKAAGIRCYRYGFISRSGYRDIAEDEPLVLIDLDEIYGM